MKTHDDILNHLEADIICFQEVKSSRSALPKSVALPPSYDAFFSFPVRKSGYSGIATYTRHSTVVPLKAEEGLCGTIESKPPLSPEERVSGPLAYPQRVLDDEELAKPSRIEEQDLPWAELDFKDLDSEGRALVLDFGLFVLINVYCPNDGNGTEERDRYKANFHRVLRARIQGLVQREGREVVLVGDINACAAVVDHCEGHLMVAKGIAEGMSGEEGFWGKEARRWLRDLIVDEIKGTGTMVDITRKLYPDRKGMYTCWNTKISARDTNYGTRIDYILITPGLLPWVKGADIQPQIKGSDHCPVYLDFLDEIPDPSREGVSIKLQDVFGVKPCPDGRRDPPRIASKFWAEYSGKQMLLMKFFGKKRDDDDPTIVPVSASSSNALSMTPSPILAPYNPTAPEGSDTQTDLLVPPDASQDSATSSTSISTAVAIDSLPPASTQTTTISSQPERESDPQPQLHPRSPNTRSSSSSKTATSVSSLPTSGVKRRLTADTLSRASSSSKRQKQQQKSHGQGQVHGQTKLSTFFTKPTPSQLSSSKRQSNSNSSFKSTSREPDPETEAETQSVVTTNNTGDPEAIEVDVDVDHLLALQSAEQEQVQTPDFLFSQVNGNGSSTSKQAWSTLLAPTLAPKCTVHGEPAKELTVTKQGPNRGKRFFICARPVGPGYDKGKAERLREHVDPQWKCDFFKWSSEVRKEMARRKGE